MMYGFALRFHLLLLAALAGSEGAEMAEVIAYLGDPQIGFSGNETEDTLRFGMAADAAKAAKAVVVAGDLVNSWNSASQISSFKQVWPARFASPVHLVPGNHDVDSALQDAGAALARLKHYRETFSADDYSAFHTGLASFVLVNSEFLILPFLGLNGTAVDPAITAEVEKQWTFIENELAAARSRGSAHTIVVMHHPPFITAEDEPHQYYNWPVAPRRRLMSLLRKFAVRTLLCGHTHTTRTVTTADGLKVLTTAGTAKAFDDNGCGYQLLNITATSLDVAYVELQGGGGAPGCVKSKAG